MFEKLEIFSMASGLARHAVDRQNAIARNVANADTPDYRATDIKSFSETYHSGASGVDMRSSRAGHIGGNLDLANQSRIFQTDDPVSPNGNSVSLESEMVKAGQVQHQHELALSVYSKSMDILRASLGSR